MANTKAPKKASNSRSGNGSTSAAKKKTAESASGSEQKNPDLEKFFLDCLKDIYWAEKHLTKALPKMQKAANSEELQQAIEDHLEQTKEHVNRLEQVFEQLGEKAQAKKCEAMEGISKEGDSVVEETEEGTAVRDAGVIMASQKVEHYEIATYGTLVQLAKTMGEDEIADILTQTLEEEKEADDKLSEIAENSINWEAQEESGEEEEDEK